jgi:hypothetical protein
MELGRDPGLRNFSLFEQLGALAKNSAASVSPFERAALVLPALTFPLSSEKQVSTRNWPNPVENMLDTVAHRPNDDVVWIDRVRQLLHAAEAGHGGRAEAVLRLAYLHDHTALTNEEGQVFGRALWSAVDEASPPLPTSANLFPHMFARLPAPEGINSRAVVQTRLYDAPEPLIEVHRLSAIVAASSVDLPGGPILPTLPQAIRLFERMTAWRPPPKPSPPDIGDALRGSERRRIQQLVGQAIAFAVAPALDDEMRSEENARAVLALGQEGAVSSAIAALPYFVAAGLRRALLGRTFEEVAAGTIAVTAWIRLERAKHYPPLPRELVDHVISAIELGREPGLAALLRCLRELVETAALTPEQEERGGQALAQVMVETSYNHVDRESRSAISVSLARAECVQLAHALQRRGVTSESIQGWLNAAEMDPLPEVRFALAERR